MKNPFDLLRPSQKRPIDNEIIVETASANIDSKVVKVSHSPTAPDHDAAPRAPPIPAPPRRDDSRLSTAFHVPPTAAFDPNCISNFSVSNDNVFPLTIESQPACIVGLKSMEV